MFYDPDRQQLYRDGRAAKILGLSADNCADHGLVAVTVAPRPELTGMQRAVRDALPVEQQDGTWQLGWTVQDLDTVPARVTMRQARLALLGADLLSGVDAAIAAMESPAREAAQIEWEYAATVDRDSPLIAALGAALNLDAERIDELFRQAVTL